MEETVKNRINLILGVFCLIFFISTIGSCSSAYRQKAARDKEMVTRLDAEEELNKLKRQTQANEDKVKSLAQELEEEKAVHQLTKKALSQEQLVNKSLKDELGKVSKRKEELEEIVADKSKKNK